MKLEMLYEGSLFECQMLKDLLENEGIESQVTDEIIGSRGGNVWRPAGNVKLFISDENIHNAIPILKSFMHSIKQEPEGNN